MDGRFIYEIRGINMYEIMKEDIERFDTSDYPKDNQFGLAFTKQEVIELMKDECNGKIMTEFIGLRSKMVLRVPSTLNTIFSYFGNVLSKNFTPINMCKTYKNDML